VLDWQATEIIHSNGKRWSITPGNLQTFDRVRTAKVTMNVIESPPNHHFLLRLRYCCFKFTSFFDFGFYEAINLFVCMSILLASSGSGGAVVTFVHSRSYRSSRRGASGEGSFQKGRPG
jgi:hypothetical protein